MRMKYTSLPFGEMLCPSRILKYKFFEREKNQGRIGFFLFFFRFEKQMLLLAADDVNAETMVIRSSRIVCNVFVFFFL